MKSKYGIKMETLYSGQWGSYYFNSTVFVTFLFADIYMGGLIVKNINKKH